MAQVPNIKRNLENGQIYIPLWINGVHVNRSPLMTPISALGIQVISRYDTLWGGSNMELSMQNTLARRPAFPQWCNQAFGSSEWPLDFYSYKNLSGTITPLVDTQTNIYSFTPTAKTSIFSKSGGAAQTSFQKVGNCLYMADGVDFVAVADNGTIGTARPVGLAVPTVSPTFTIGSKGFLLPTTGWTYGFSYGDSTSGQVSTMSPISSDVGDLNVQSVTDSSLTFLVTTVSTAGSSGGSAGTVTFGTPNGNSLWVGAKVVLSGFGQAQMNGTYTLTVASGTSFGASTAQWGPASGGFGQNANVQLSNLTGVKAVMNPITIPGAGAASPFVYTVAQAANFAPTNAWDAVSPSPFSVTGPAGSPVYVQIQSGTPSTGHYVVNASTGAITFASADAGKSIIVNYAVTPVTGGNPVSFALTGPSSNNAFSAGTQTDTTGYSIADNVVVYRDQDSDGTAGPWFFLATIPNNIALSSATYTSQTNQTTYTFTTACLAGNNNRFAGATGTGGATIAGFSNTGNNGTFDIVASTTTSITCTNPNGVTETHAATVNSGVWKYTDTGAVYGYAFDPTVPDGELDILVEAPINDENNPPPNTTNPVTTSVTGTFSLVTYHAGRMWGAVGNYVYFAGGSDVTFGSPTESWPPANVFTYPGKVTAFASCPAGLVVFVSDEMHIIYGTSTGTFYSQRYQKTLGVPSQNCVVLDGDVLFIYSNQSQLWSFTDSLSEIGFNVAPLLSATFSPASTYLTMHRSGEDVGLFISDGSTNYMKYRPDQQSWSPLCQIVNGANCLKSIETSTSVYTLLAGAATGSSHIAGRSLTSWADMGGTYTCSAIVGSLIVSPPGTTARIEFLTSQFMNTGTAPVFSVLTQDVATLSGSGSWVALGTGVVDPPGLIHSGSATMFQQRFYLKSASTPVAQDMCNLMIKVAFPSENFKAEILTLGVE
jgi:hypothetical protein